MEDENQLHFSFSSAKIHIHHKEALGCPPTSNCHILGAKRIPIPWEGFPLSVWLESFCYSNLDCRGGSILKSSNQQIENPSVAKRFRIMTIIKCRCRSGHVRGYSVAFHGYYGFPPSAFPMVLSCSCLRNFSITSVFCQGHYCYGSPSFCSCICTGKTYVLPATPREHSMGS